MAWVDAQGHVFRLRTQPYLCSIVVTSVLVYEIYEDTSKAHDTVHASMRLMQSMFYLSKVHFWAPPANSNVKEPSRLAPYVEELLSYILQLPVRRYIC